MSIKSTALGGTDLADHENFKFEDWNDTLNAMYNKLIKGSMFWTNTELYDEYDDCGTGADVIGDKWAVSQTGTGVTPAYANSANAGGTAYELELTGGDGAGSGSSTADTNAATSNRSYWMRVRARGVMASSSGTNTAVCYFRIYNSSGSPVSYEIGRITPGGAASGFQNTFTDIKVVNTATDTYDIWIGGKKVVSGHTAASDTLVFGFQATGSTDAYMVLHVDDVRYSKEAA